MDWIGRVLASVALLVAAPVLVLCAAAIVLTDGRPILFRQVRFGKAGKTFELLKLRSMSNHAAGRKVTARSDPRITSVGRVLRNYKLDELPQLWNVVRGDMSLIGPRPEVPEYVDLADPRWKAVLSVKPGLTDLATLAFRNEETLLAGADDTESLYRNWLLPRKLELSAHYIATRTWASDIRLLTLTLWHTIFPGSHDARSVVKHFDYRENL